MNQLKNNQFLKNILPEIWIIIVFLIITLWLFFVINTFEANHLSVLHNFRSFWFFTFFVEISINKTKLLLGTQNCKLYCIISRESLNVFVFWTLLILIEFLPIDDTFSCKNSVLNFKFFTFSLNCIKHDLSLLTKKFE